MKRILFILASLTASTAPIAAQQAPNPQLQAMLDSLSRATRYEAMAEFVVSMPQMPDDVTYKLNLLTADAAPGDTLSNCSYLIDWQLSDTEGSTATSGFSAYCNGSHYRYRGGSRLQEYHATDDPAPFNPMSTGGRRLTPVHKGAQFANTLPPYIADEIRLNLSDPSYSYEVVADTVIDGQKRTVMLMQRTIGGEVVQEGEYQLDPATFMPVKIEFENNPGSLSEQTVIVRYQPSAQAAPALLNEQALIDRYPDVFERFRESTFRVENLGGEWLPAFSLPTVTGERYSRSLKDPFKSPAMILIYDPSAGFAAEAVADLKAVAGELPYTPQLIFASLSTNIDAIEHLLPADTPDQYRLMSAGSLARDCGVAEPPVLIIVDKSGRISEAIVGYNKNFRSDVIQKMSLLKP